MSTSSSAKTYTHGFWFALIGVTVVAIGAIATFFILTRPPKEPIPTWQSELNFSPFLISKNKGGYTESDHKVSTSEEGEKILSYIVTTPQTKVTLSEYPQPPQFNDIPEYRDRFLNNIASQYKTVQSASGVIYLGKMVKQDGRQLGIMLERGLIVFMNPEHELSDTQWRQLGDLLEIRKITQ
jgi:hypothetical protein